MKIFGFKKRKDLIDLTEHYKKQQEKMAQTQKTPQTSTSDSDSFNFLKNLASNSQDNSNNSDSDVSVIETDHERKRKLAKRLMDMTNKMEELSNQIYHMQQRIEVLEKKLNSNRF